MGVETLVAMAAIGSVASAGGSIFSGIQANKSAKKEAALQREQANILLSESQQQADRTRRAGKKLLGQQVSYYTGQGVSLEGSPLAMLQETSMDIQSDIDAILNRGYAQYKLGTAQSKMTKSSGRTAFIGSLFNAGSSLTSGASSIGTYKMLQKAG